MSRTSCLAGVEDDKVEMLERVLRDTGAPHPAHVERRLSVSTLGALSPDLLLCDIDGSDVDSLELLRRLRFVLPGCIITIYTGLRNGPWALACHLAGASCLLSKDSSEAELRTGLSEGLRTGCFTDPRFAAA
jgi:DNA-binding NarL/FixJ family response regulator